MGFFLRKSLGKIGPVRFSLSTSGIGMSAGVRGARIGVGPRGAYVAGGRGGLYYRKYLNTGSKTSASVVASVEPTEPSGQEHSDKESNGPPKPGGYAAFFVWGLASMLFLLGSLSEFTTAPFFIGIVLLLIAVATWRKRNRRIAWFGSHDALLTKLSATPDEKLLADVKRSLESSEFQPSEWHPRHEQVYRRIFSDSLAGGIDGDEKGWLDAVADMLKLRGANAIHAEVLRALIWQFVADGQVTKEEEVLAEELIRAVGLSKRDLAEELVVMDEFVRGREVRESGLPVVEVGINLQRGEVCHHLTKGAFMDKKVLRSYTRDGQRYKEEGLVVSKQGDIYITSKRILMVSDGTSSIAHEKVLDIEVNQDDKLIEIVKDGRQKPLYIKVPDAVYTGILIEMLSEAGS